MEKKTDVAVTHHDNVHDSVTRPAEDENYATPSVDIYQTAEAFVVLIDMPGARKEAICVSMDRGALVVKAPIEPYHAGNPTLLRTGINGSGYYRAFNLGEGIDTEDVDARYTDGVLTLKLFRREESRPKRIRIR